MEFPTPAEIKQQRELKTQERVNKLLNEDRAFIINKLTQSAEEIVAIKPSDLKGEFSILQKELEQKGYEVWHGPCTCHGMRGIIGPGCGRHRIIKISLNPDGK